jgi:hypothetical protein
LKEGIQMKRNYLWVAGVLISTFVAWVACVENAMAANPTEVVIFSCMEKNPATGYTVLTYDASPSAPAKPSTDCAAALEALLNAGLTNVNVSVQTYTGSVGAGAPNGTDGTYITYVLANGTLTSGNL